MKLTVLAQMPQALSAFQIMTPTPKLSGMLSTIGEGDSPNVYQYYSVRAALLTTVSERAVGMKGEYLAPVKTQEMAVMVVDAPLVMGADLHLQV